MSSREVVLDGGSPWGFRMHGGVDVHQPLRISRVNPGSKASQKGIREGDFISSINGQSTKNITNADAHALLKNSGQTLRLGLNEDISGSPKRRLGKNSQEGDSLKRSSITSISSTSTINRVLSSIHNTNNEINTSNNTNDSQQPKGDHQLVSPSLSSSDRQNGLNGSLVADSAYHQRHSRTSVSASNSFTVGTPVEPRGGDKTNAKGVSVRSIVMADSKNGGGENSSTGSGEPAGGRRSARNRRRAHHRSRKSSSKNVVTVAESIAETNEHEENLSTIIDISTNRNVVIDNNEISLCTTGGETVSDKKIPVDTVETASKVTDVELVNEQTVNIDSAVNKSAEKSSVEQCSEIISTSVSSQEIVVEAEKSNSSKFQPEKKHSKSRKRSSKNNKNNKAAAVQVVNKNTENVCDDYFKETEAQAGSEESREENDRQKENENTGESETDLCTQLKTNTQHLSNLCNENDFIDKRKSTVSCDSVDEEVEKITSAMEYGQSHYSVYMEQCSLFTRIETETNLMQPLSREESKIASEQENENKRESVEDNLSDRKIKNLAENPQDIYKENMTKQLLEKSVEQTEINTAQVTAVENTTGDTTINSIQSKQNENIEENETIKQEQSFSENESKNNAPELELNFEFDSNEKISTEMKITTVTGSTCIKNVKNSVMHESVDGGKKEQKTEDFQIQKTEEIKAPSTENDNLVSKEPKNEDCIEKGISSDSLGASISSCTGIKNEQNTIKETTASMTLHHNILELTTVNIESDSEVVVYEQNYRVESPPPPVANKNSKSPKIVVPKSRSLDDDENKVEITEIVESTEEHDEEKCLSKQLVENSAIISEADDVKWEEAGVLRIAEKAKPSFSIIGLSLEDDFKRTESFETKGAMSPEDEKNLREFLEGLKLATSPLEATRQLSEKTSKDLLTPENLSVRKAKKRAELELFFQPAFMNPRYLNVIQEEGVEMSSSGRDSKTVSESRSWTDDWDIDDDVFINDDNTNSLKNEPMVFNQKQVKLVNAKMVEIQGEYSKECMWTTHKMEPSSGAEIVFLEDSSCSRTPSDIPEQENASDAEDEASCEDRLCWEKDDDIYENVEYKDGHPLFQDDDKPDAIAESCDRLSDDNRTDNNIDKKQNIAPLPTPEMSNIGKNENSEEPLSEEIKSFIKKLLEVLAQTDNSEKVYELLKETPLEKFPDEMKETVRDLLNAHHLDISDQCKILESSEETINSEITVGVEVSNNELTEVVLKVTDKNIDEHCTVELSRDVVTADIELTGNVKSPDNSELKEIHNNESATLEKSDEEIQSNDTVEKLKNEIMSSLNNENLQNDIDEEFEKLYSNLKCQESVKSSDKSSPVNSRPESSASVCSSTSQSTAKFIPSCASLADIAALLHDEPVYENVFSKRSVSKERSVHRQNKVNSLKETTPKSKSETPVYEDIQASPKSLRELCVQNILSQPYGADVLEELAIVSETIENLTADVPAVEDSTNKTEEPLKCKSDENINEAVTKSDHNSKLIETEKYNSSKYDENVHYSTSDETDYHQQYVVFNSCKVSPASNISHQQHEHYFSQYDSDTSATVANNNYCPIDSSPMSMSMRTSPDGWVGIPTQDDPNVLVCLSPSQKTYIDRRQCIDKNEADQLLDMHKKFLERRCYHEEQIVLPVKNIPKDKVTLSRYVDTPGWISENVLKTQSMAMKNAAAAPDKNTTLKNVPASSSEKACFPRGEEGRDKAVCDEKECTSSSNRLLAIIRDTSSDDCRKMCTSAEMQRRDFEQRGNTAHIVTEPDNGNKVLNYNERIRKLMTNNNNNNNDVTNYKCLTYDDTIRELQKISKIGNNNESGETTSVLSVNNRRKSLTMPLRDLNNDYKINDDREKSEDRLKARQLSEWMQLARNRSSVPANFEFKIDGNNSSSVKGVAVDAKRVLTANKTPPNLCAENKCSGAVRVDDCTVQRLFTGERKRFSLPQDMHERQLQYILEQERAIEREIRELEKEKTSSMPDDTRRPVTTGQSKQSFDSSLFQRENKNVYHISKKGDVATIQSDFDLPFAKSKNRTEETNARPKSMSSLQTLVTHGERFRQQMYDEYMHKVAEREERKQHKVIKISSSKPVSSSTDSDLHAEIFKQHALKIESEFMNRVKERMDKLGLNFSDDEGDAAKQTESHNESEPVLVIDGSSLKEGKDLPKHLQEFVNFTSSTEITGGQSESVSCSESKTVKLLSSNKTEINRVLVNTPSESKSFIPPVTPSKTDERPKEDEEEEEEVSRVLIHSITPSNVDECPVKEKLKKAEESTDTSSVVRRLLEMAKASTRDDEGIWSPSHKKSSSTSEATAADRSAGQEAPSSRLPPATPSGGDRESREKEGSPPPPIWTPRSAEPSPQAERKEFRPVRFESPVLGRKHKASSEEAKTPESRDSPAQSVPPPWQPTFIGDHQQSSAAVTVTQSLERRLPTSHSAPAGGTLSSLVATSRLPRAQNPTITLLQKAREGQLPRGASYLEEARKSARRGNDRPPLLNPHEAIYSVKNEYTSESESEGPKRMVDLGPRKFEGIGPTTKDGMPIVLRSEVKDSNQAKWYKRMYETLHKAKDDSEYVTVRYKQRRAGRYPYTSGSGYLSEPEPNAFGGYDSDTTRQYATLDRRRPVSSSMSPAPVGKENSYISSTMPRNNKHMSASAVKYATDIYKNQPGRIENYMPGHSSISEKEAKEWWDEVMEIFDGHLEQQKHVTTNRQYMAHALKESGYESDSTLIFRRRDETSSQQLSPQEQKEAYKTIQRGGEVPLHGLRKPAPERPKESPRRYVENEVTIHYRSPVRQEVKEILSEEELARRQAEAMRRIYQEERRRKYLQELQDMNSRRHTDNFTPSQKSPIPLNRYDDFDEVSMTKQMIRSRDRTPEPRLVARALFNFVGQSSRELTFKKGDIIYVRRQIDKNWYEGEHNAMIGLFPVNYVEIIPYDGFKTVTKKPHEGQARAKFNFIAQTHLELSLAKGETVVLTRRVDDNWFEGRIGNKKGIFPVSYVEVAQYPGEQSEAAKPVASPAAHSMLLNGSSGGKQSMGSHHYQPSFSPSAGSAPGTGTNSLTGSYHHAKPVNVMPVGSISSLTRPTTPKQPPVDQTLHVDTHSEPIPYRAMYKYRPQNEDELELQEGDTVYVLEKCDDGWYVGSSQRTGAFGTFPGNYVERI